MACYHCKNNLDAYLTNKVSRQDSCSQCHRDIRCCSNCEFFDRNAHWECKETVAEHVIDKEKATFCDMFRLSQKDSAAGVTSSKDTILSAAEALFKKK